MEAPTTDLGKKIQALGLTFSFLPWGWFTPQFLHYQCIFAYAFTLVFYVFSARFTHFFISNHFYWHFQTDTKKSQHSSISWITNVSNNLKVPTKQKCKEHLQHIPVHLFSSFFLTLEFSLFSFRTNVRSGAFTHVLMHLRQKKCSGLYFCWKHWTWAHRCDLRPLEYMAKTVHTFWMWFKKASVWTSRYC